MYIWCWDPALKHRLLSATMVLPDENRRVLQLPKLLSAPTFDTPFERVNSPCQLTIIFSPVVHHLAVYLELVFLFVNLNSPQHLPFQRQISDNRPSKSLYRTHSYQSRQHG